jgi:hypothetical protein
LVIHSGYSDSAVLFTVIEGNKIREKIIAIDEKYSKYESIENKI